MTTKEPIKSKDLAETIILLLRQVEDLKATVEAQQVTIDAHEMKISKIRKALFSL